MNFLRNELVYLEEERVNQWPDRMDRALPRHGRTRGEKVCRPDRYVPAADFGQAKTGKKW